MTSRIIPFNWFPAHWGLKGKRLEIAQAEFEFEGTELLRKKIDINVNERSKDEQAIAHLDLDHRIGKIKDYQYARGVIKININRMSVRDVKLALLDLKKEYAKRTEQEYEKERATLMDEPWVIIKKLQTDPDNPKYGGVELDWNDLFVKNLEKHGYGPNPEAEDTVNDWFNELCRNIALEAYAGIGDFEEQVGMGEEIVAPRTSIHEDVLIRPVVKSKEKPKKDSDDKSED